jgi:hypothetical protein
VLWVSVIAVDDLLASTLLADTGFQPHPALLLAPHKIIVRSTLPRSRRKVIEYMRGVAHTSENDEGRALRPSRELQA